MSGTQPPTEDRSRWACLGHSRRDSVADVMREVFADADLTIHVDLWHRPFDPFVKGAPWWQWRTPCDCPDTSFGRNPHRWNCALTPIWSQTIRDLDTNPWTVVTNAIWPIPQLEVWRRVRAADSAIVDYAMAMAIDCTVGTLSAFLGIAARDDWPVDAAKDRADRAVLAAHPLTLAADWGAHTETDYYGG